HRYTPSLHDALPIFIQSGMFGQQPQGHGHAAAEGLHETAVFMSLVELLYDGHQPALAACPLEQRFKHRSPLTTRFAGTKGVWSRSEEHTSELQSREK